MLPGFGAPKNPRKWAFDTQGGYTPWDFVHFTDQYNKHEHTFTVEADAMRCYELWKDPTSLVTIFDLITDYTELTEEDGPEMAGMTWYYKMGTYPKLELKTQWKRVEDEPGEVLQIVSVDGMPLSALVAFDAKGPNETEVNFQFAYAMPRELGLFEEPIAVHSHVDFILRGCMDSFKQKAESQRSIEG